MEIYEIQHIDKVTFSNIAPMWNNMHWMNIFRTHNIVNDEEV